LRFLEDNFHPPHQEEATLLAFSEKLEQHLNKREVFAVSLRREKKVKILAEKRQKMMQRLNLCGSLVQT